ncbi:MAG: ribosome-associated translation inhibitor RaiA [Ignavibacteriales bacterium]|nr:ribosome-associated translation inhibitor RaiA [Ignavibacteriales bacterium]
MDIKITARHFKAHETLREYAYNGVKRLERYYNGIVQSDVILSFERSRNSLKIAEIHILVHGTLLKSIEKSDDFFKSIEMAMEKMERQLKRYKSKLHHRDKEIVRLIHEKV